MPFLRLKGFKEEFLRSAVQEIIDVFSQAAEVPKEIVKIEMLNIIQLTCTPLSIEIYMFARDQGKYDVIAKSLDKLLKRHGHSGLHIFFITLNQERYYKNGLPLQDAYWLP